MLSSFTSMWSWWWDARNEKDQRDYATLTALLSIFAVFWLLRAIMKPKKVVPPLPPGPRGLPLVGYLPFIGTQLHKKFEELSRVYGPIHKVWLGKKLCVVISSPSLLKEVLCDQDRVFANRDPPIAGRIFSYGAADIALSSYGDDWRKLRKVFVREMLSNANLDSSYTLLVEEVKKSIRNVHEKIGTPVNLGELAFVTVVNAVMSMVWGDTLQGEEGAGFGAQFKSIIADQMELIAKPNVSDFFPILARFDLQGIERKSKWNLQWVEKILDSAIEKRMNMAKAEEGGKGKFQQSNDFLQILLELREHGDAATTITMTQLKAMLMVIVVGGSDTTATMVEWVMAELLQHPEAMKKVGEELTEVVGLDNLVEKSHLPKLHYLDAVIKESSRLHPAFPLLIPHCPSQSSTVGGYHVPKGATIFLNVWAVHRDPRIWENPLEFKPERFLSDFGKLDYSGNDFRYVPFGSGGRICAGLPLAERLLVHIVASLLHSYKWKLPNGVELEFSEKFGIVTKKRNPVFAIPTSELCKFELFSE